jgi:hypothetical protein
VCCFTAVELIEHLWRAVPDNSVGCAVEVVCRNDLIVIDEGSAWPTRSRWLPAAVPAHRCRLRTALSRDRLTQSVRSMGRFLRD